MDSVLLEYLRSGSAWLLVGAGPSIDMGYPTWAGLAQAAVQLAESEGEDPEPARTMLSGKDYPGTFQAVADQVGLPRLIDYLRGQLHASRPGTMYSVLAQWPIPVYLTTNFDDELSSHLSQLGLGYQTYSNSMDHMGLLNPALTNAIFKLHGDLRSAEGLVLTSGQYRALESDPEWDHWRTKLTSIFQMHPVVIVGHSLTDPHISFVLKAAKAGASVSRPVCWISPNVTIADSRTYLEKFKIRVVSYPAGDDDHRGLRTLLGDISRFIPPRTEVHMATQVAAVIDEGRTAEPAAAAVFVFNRLAPYVDPLDLRVAVAAAASESQFANLPPNASMSIPQALLQAGWPEASRPAAGFVERIEKSLLASGIVEKAGNGFAPGAEIQEAKDRQGQFEHMRRSFRDSLRLRLQRDCPDLGESTWSELATDIEAAITGYFRVGGLTLATLLFATGTSHVAPTVPTSVVGFLNQASAKYRTLGERRAFSHVSLDVFIDSTTAEREYLGRLAQGFFAFHALGAFGEAAVERLRRAQDTVWLIDSNTLIPLLALAAPSNAAFMDGFQRLKAGGIRAFTSDRLLDEASEHLAFAAAVVDRFDSDSPFVIAAAAGEPPYRRQNLFLQGFIRWRASGRGDEWPSYLHALFDTRAPDRDNLSKTLKRLGVEPLSFAAWPGFNRNDYAEAEEVKASLKEFMLRSLRPGAVDRDFDSWLEDKLPPEAEAVVIIRHERTGKYHVLSSRDNQSPAFFVSSTSAINAIVLKELRITWQPEAFLAFVGSLMTGKGGASSDRAFEVIVWTVARSGANPITEATIERVFGSVIDQTSIIAGEERQVYDEMLANKYGESSELVLARIPASRRAIAALQLNNEIVQAQEQRVEAARTREKEAASRATVAERALTAVEKYRVKQLKKQASVTANKKKRAGRARAKKRQ